MESHIKAQKQINKTMFKEINELKAELKEIKNNQINKNESNIKEMQALKDMMSELLDKKIDPIYVKLEEYDKRLKLVEDRPQMLAFKICCWLVGIFGSLTITLLSYIASMFYF